MKVMVIGLDGCTFNVLNDLIAQGKLPCFASLIKHGVSGNLRSTIPPASAAAWTTFQTGKQPGKHGLFDFFRNCPESYTYIPVNSTFIKTETFWERLSRQGKSVGIVNFLFTYPPPNKLNGFVITGKQTPSESVNYTYPLRLKQEILQFEPRYQVDPFKRVSQSGEFLRDIPDCLRIQERVNLYLLRTHPTDLFMSLCAVPDVIQHLFWRHMDPSHPTYSRSQAKKYYPLIEDVFQTLDDIIAKRIEGIDEDTIVVIMSDHGAGSLNKIVELNRWLQEQNLLHLKSSSHTTRTVLLRRLWKQVKRLDAFLGKFDTRGLRRRVKLATRERRRTLSKRALIDWSKSKAYMGRIGEDGIYCNLQGREKHGIVAPGAEYERLREQIISGLSQITDPQTGQKIFKAVHKREDVYRGPFLHLAPDILLETGDLPYQVGDELLCENIFEDVGEQAITGKHHPDGILIVYGKGIRNGAVIQGASICDLAPTILYMMGEKVPADMDGKVLQDLFEDLVFRGRPIRYDKSPETKHESEELVFGQKESEEIETRLKDLGYL